MPGPWEKYAQGAPQSAPQAGPPAFIPGTPKPAAQPTPFQVRDQQMQEERFAWEKNKKTQTDQGIGKAMTTNKRGELQDSLSALDQFESDLDLIGQKFKDDFKDQGLGTVREILPEWANTTNQDYNATSRRLLPLVAKALGFTSKQMDTPAEIKRLEAYVPLASDGDETAQHKLDALRGMLVRQRKNISSQLQQGGPSPQTETPASTKRLKFNPATGKIE